MQRTEPSQSVAEDYQAARFAANDMFQGVYRDSLNERSGVIANDYIKVVASFVPTINTLSQRGIEGARLAFKLAIYLTDNMFGNPGSSLPLFATLRMKNEFLALDAATMYVLAQLEDDEGFTMGITWVTQPARTPQKDDCSCSRPFEPANTGMTIAQERFRSSTNRGEGQPSGTRQAVMAEEDLVAIALSRWECTRDRIRPLGLDGFFPRTIDRLSTLFALRDK